MALGLPPLEMIVGGLLLSGWQRRVAALSALMLTGVFLLALGSAIARGLTIDCGCFGGDDAKGDLWMALLRDLTLGASLICVYLCEADEGEDRRINDRVNTPAEEAGAA